MNITLRLANYMSRYAPSRSRVMEYLEKKKCTNPIELLIESGYDESIMLDMWMRTFVTLGKSKSEITNRLMKKGFPKELIYGKLELFTMEIYDWQSNQSNIKNQIQTLIQRGKSSRIISALLISRYPYFRDEIKALMESNDDRDNLEKEVQKYKNRYTIDDKKNREKMIASLLRKGFSYSNIKECLSHTDSINS